MLLKSEGITDELQQSYAPSRKKLFFMNTSQHWLCAARDNFDPRERETKETTNTKKNPSLFVSLLMLKT